MNLELGRSDKVNLKVIIIWVVFQTVRMDEIAYRGHRKK